MSNTDRKNLTQTTLKEYLSYSPETGIFTRIKSSRKTRVGEIAGSLMTTGYITIRVMSLAYQAHRLAFLYMLGEIPEYVDHIDGNRANNKWDNLRPATSQQNGYNAKVRSDTTTGVKGISDRNRYYQASINIPGRRVLNCFRKDKYDSDDLAKKAAENWLISMREVYHKEFARHD
jgi:hypothetical protein